MFKREIFGISINSLPEIFSKKIFKTFDFSKTFFFSLTEKKNYFQFCFCVVSSQTSLDRYFEWEIRIQTNKINLLFIPATMVTQSLKGPELRSLEEMQLSRCEFDCRWQYWSSRKKFSHANWGSLRQNTWTHKCRKIMLMYKADLCQA